MVIERKRRALVRGATALVPGGLVLALVFLSAAPAGAAVASVSGGAFGVSASGLVNVAPTPEVSLPGTGGGPYVASQSVADVPGLVEVGETDVSTSGTTGAGGQAQSSSDVQLVDALGGTLTIGEIGSSCSSSQSGSVGATTVAELEVDGSAVSLPDPVPPDYGLSVPGVVSATLNYQTTSSGLRSSSITVDALQLTLVGGLVTVDVGGSSCGSTYSGGNSNG